ncbi:MAG: NUDIX hydrolase [Acidimicrobiia bacterium]
MTDPAGGQQIPRPPLVRLGAPAPWLRLASDERVLRTTDIRRVCATLPAPRRSRLSVPGMQQAAVLVPLFEEDGAVRVVLTKRPDTMPSHRGDIAFPGGKVHPEVDRSLLDAALREAQEEVGLEPGAVEVVAELESLSTVTTRFVISPFVGLLAGRPHLVADQREVVRVFDVALADLLADGVHREELWGAGPLARAVHFFELDSGVGGDPDGGMECIWGATARILAEFLTVLTASR